METETGSCVSGRDSSCPSSPIECSKTLNYDEEGKLASSNFPESAEGSLKSKKSGLSTGKKSKNDGGGGPSEASYANSLELEAELNVQSVPPTKSNSNGTEGLENEQNSVS